MATKRTDEYEFDIDGEPIDLTSTDRDYLIRCKVSVDEKCASVRAQITEAKREFASGGRGADPDWLRRAESAARVLGKASQVLQARLGEVRRAASEANREALKEAIIAKRDPAAIAAKKAHARAWSEAFVDAARAILAKDDFANLCQIAHKVVGEKP